MNEHAIKHYKPYIIHVNLSWFKNFQLAYNKYSSVRLDAIAKAEVVISLKPFSWDISSLEEGEKKKNLHFGLEFAILVMCLHETLGKGGEKFFRASR